MRFSRLKHLDNDAWLWLRVRATTLMDGLGAARALRSGRLDLRSLESFFTFIGYPRSGHSVVSSILDAHPDAVCSHRLDALKFIARGESAEKIFYRIVRNAERFADSGRRLTGYSYPIRDQWQGRSRELKAIGDQEARWATLRLRRDPAMLAEFRRRLELKFVHVVRNPYDNITTMANRKLQHLSPAIDAYFELCDGVAEIKRSFGREKVLDMHHEALVSHPAKEIRRLCEFLHLDPAPDYLESCGKLVHKKPHQSRSAGDWTPDLIGQVAERSDAYDFLSGYGYETDSFS